MDEHGQTSVEYVLLVVLLTAVAVTGWQVFYPALGQFYRHLADRRAGVEGMLP